MPYNFINDMAKEVISNFKERPKSKIAWRAMGLGLSTLLVPPLLGFSAAVLRPIIDAAAGEKIGSAISFGVAAFALALPIAALIIGRRALKQGERSWAVWLGLAPAILIGAFWIFMLIGELILPH